MASSFSAMGSKGGNVPVPFYAEYSKVIPSSSTNRPVGAYIFVTTVRQLYLATNESSSSTGVSTTWELVTDFSSGIQVIDGDTGSVEVTTVPNTVNIVGDGVNISTAGSGDTLTITQNANGTFSSLVATTAATDVTEWANLTTGTLTIGGTAQTGAISLGTGTATQTVDINTGAGVKTTVVGSTNTTSTTTVQSGSGALNVTSTGGALTIDSGTGALGISTDASATTVSIGTGAAVKAVTLGSTNTTSATTVQAGSGGIALTGAVTSANAVSVTSGNITATAGNLVVSTSGDGLVLPVVTASGAASGTVDCNGRVGSVTFTTVSIAAGASLTLTLGNTSIAGASTRLLWSLSGATAGAALCVESATPTTNAYAWVVTNGTGATTSTADITFDFIVLN